jgi:hypothetical protein
MRTEDALDETDDRRRFLNTVAAGLAALCAAALAVGTVNGVPWERFPGLAAPAPEPGLAAAGARGGAAQPPVLRLCFRGPRGEPVDFPTAQYCP